MNTKMNSIDDILKALPEEVIGQKIFKTKVIFLDVKKDDSHYSPTKRFGVNGRNYLVHDGGIAYLPEEAFNALNDAVTVERKFRDKRQAHDGVDHDNPDDRYVEVKNNRFDLTVIDVFTLMIEDDKKIFVSQNESASAKAQDETIQKIITVKEKEIRQQVEEELRSSIREELMKELTPEISDEDIDSLTSEDGDE